MLRIISGAQTGVDQGALQAALDMGFNIGGWYPKNEQTMTYKGIPPQFKRHMKEMTDELFPELKPYKTEDWCTILKERGESYRPKDSKELTEDEIKIYERRTSKNAEDSDGTLILILNQSEFYGGTLATKIEAMKYGKPTLVVNMNEEKDGQLAEKIALWIINNNIMRLNIGGPNESKSPGIQQHTTRFVKNILKYPAIRKLSGLYPPRSAISLERCLTPSEFFKKPFELNLYKKAEELYDALISHKKINIEIILNELDVKDKIQVLSLTIPKLMITDHRFEILKNIKDKYTSLLCLNAKKIVMPTQEKFSFTQQLPEIPINHRHFIEDYLTGKTNENGYITYENYKEILRAIKIIDIQLSHVPSKEKEGLINRSSYELRSRCIEVSKGELYTHIAYTKSFIDDEILIKDPRGTLACQRASTFSEYIPERQRLHAHTLAKTIIEALYLSRQYNISNPEKINILAMSGNCGSGKTFMTKNMPEMSKLNNTAIKLTFSEDAIKAFLRKNAHGVNNNQIDIEGVKLKDFLKNELLQKGYNLFLLIDSTLIDLESYLPLIQYAKKNDKTVMLMDIDCPLTLSCLRVLTRDLNSEPCLPYSVVEYNFIAVKNGKKDKINFVLNCPEIANCKFFAVDEATGKSGLAAQKKDGNLEIIDQDLYEAMLSGSQQAENEASQVRNLVIDTNLIEKYKFFGLKEYALQPFIGMNMKEALNLRSSLPPTWNVY